MCLPSLPSPSDLAGYSSIPRHDRPTLRQLEVSTIDREPLRVRDKFKASFLYLCSKEIPWCKSLDDEFYESFRIVKLIC